MKRERLWGKGEGKGREGGREGGENAKKCKEPCAWEEKDIAAMGSGDSASSHLFYITDVKLVVHIDLVGPYPPSQGFTYLLTCVDRFTRWPEAFPLSSIIAEAVAQAFIHYPFQCSISNYHRSRTTIRFWIVECTYSSAGGEPDTYNGVSSTVEWHGRVPSSSIEGCTQSTWQHLLDGFPAICSTWH